MSPEGGAESVALTEIRQARRLSRIAWNFGGGPVIIRRR
jgi:hypothetical protein